MHSLATVTVSDWVALLGAVATVIAAVGGTIAAVRGHQIASSVRIPSNNVKLGAVVEGISQVQHMMSGLMHPDANIPPAVAVGRTLEQNPPQPGLRVGDAPPEVAPPVVPAPPPAP